MAQGEEDVAGTKEFVFVLKQMGQQLRAVSQSQAGRIPTYILRNVTRAGQQLREWTREENLKNSEQRFLIMLYQEANLS